MSIVETVAAKILVVDDDLQTRALLCELCESLGYAVLSAADGDEALQRLEDGPDLLLLDLMMPRVDGFAVLKQVRETPSTSDLPVIILTAYGDVDGKIRAIELGADDYVTKPFRLVDLQTRIRTALSVRRYRNRLKQVDERRGEEPSAPADTSLGAFPELKAGLESAVARARRDGRPLAAVVVTIDDFGLLSQRLDRAAVDATTLALAETLRSALRDADRVFRLDSEELLALLPDTDAAGGQRAAERILGAVKRRPPTAPGLNVPVTVSAGVAVFPSEAIQTPDDLVRAAHEALGRPNRAAASIADGRS